jgi:hypothetical protein
MTVRGYRRFVALWAVSILASAMPLAAQQQPAAGPGQSVIVVGERSKTEEEIRREASRFFESHAVRTRIGQLARWHEPICVRSWGLPPEMNAQIATRVMDIADGLGIATNRAELCRPNVRIGFTGEPQAMIARAYRRNSAVIGFHYAARTRDVIRVRQPVQAWYVTRTRSSGGEERVDQAGVRTPGGRAGSRLGSGISSGLAHVLIFADTSVVEGEDAAAIAELLAFLAFAQTPVAEGCDAANTILNLMNPACPPDRRPAALTEYDLAYLRALYSVNPEWGAQLQRGTIVTHMTDMLTGER